MLRQSEQHSTDTIRHDHAPSPGESTSTGACPVSFLIIDDHPLVTFALLHLIESQPGWTVGLHTASPRDAMDALEQHTYDIAIIDLLFPDDSGIEFIHWLAKSAPATRSIVYSMQRADIYARRCIQSGASGYVGKESPVEIILATINGVLDARTMVNGKALSPEEAASLRIRGEVGIDRLSRRELEVLTLIGQGHSNTRIAQILCRSAKTIESHRYRISNKLEIENGPPLVHFAMQHSIASAPHGAPEPSSAASPKEGGPTNAHGTRR